MKRKMTMQRFRSHLAMRFKKQEALFIWWKGGRGQLFSGRQFYWGRKGTTLAGAIY